MRVLEPIERISEVLFGLIMVLTFTGSLSAAESGQAEVRAMLIGAHRLQPGLGPHRRHHVSHGCLAERAADRRIIAAVQRAATAEQAGDIVARTLPSPVATILTPADLDRIRLGLSRLPDPTERIGLEREDWLGAAAVFLLVFVSTIPVVLPFVILDNAGVALRISNAIAVAMMFVTGYAFGRAAGYRPWLMAGSMVLLGACLVALTIALGG